MRCPECQHDEDKVLETRPVRDGAAIRRRRQCLDCDHRFTTYEYVELAAMEVVKKDGRREPYQRDKVLHGLFSACEKRPISQSMLQEIVDEMERRLFRMGTEVKTNDIGRAIMARLYDLDLVAYVRFASVYLNFNRIQQFVEMIEELPEDEAR